MPKHRSRPAVRREPNPVAKWLVTGTTTTTAILHDGRTAYIRPYAAREHHKRYAAGQRLAVKAYIPGPTECHVILTAVLGPQQMFRAGHVDHATARDLGHQDVETFRIAWVREHDQSWYWEADTQAAEQSAKPDEPKGANELLDDACLERFEKRWRSKLAWLLTFRVDTAAAPRMLAATSSVYDPMKENAEGRDEDRGYTTSDSRSLADEFPALTDAEWETHVGPRSRYRSFERLRLQRIERESKSLTDRLDGARKTAKVKGYDIRDESRRFTRLLEQGKTEQARAQMDLIERRVYPAAA